MLGQPRCSAAGCRGTARRDASGCVIDQPARADPSGGTGWATQVTGRNFSSFSRFPLRSALKTPRRHMSC